MTRRVTALSVHRTALIAALCGAIFALVLALLVTPIMMLVPRNPATESAMGAFPGALLGSGAMLIMMPVTYFIFGYIFTAISVFVFNLVAPRLGGVPVTFAEDEAGAL